MRVRTNVDVEHIPFPQFLIASFRWVKGMTGVTAFTSALRPLQNLFSSLCISCISHFSLPCSNIVQGLYHSHARKQM